MEIRAELYFEEGWYWAKVPEIPGVYASGRSLDELVEALQESLAMMLEDDQPVPDLHVESGTLALA